jgi:hypothetical protein
MKVLAFSFMLLLALLTVSCGGGPSSQNSPTAQIRIMQASGDLVNVDVQLNGNTIANNLGWRQTFPTKTTSYTNVPAGTVHYQEFATGTALPALVDTHFALSSNTFYTVITAGEQSSASVATILLTDDHVVPAPGQLRLRFVNASSAAGPIDLYFLSGSNAGSPSTPSVPALGYKSASGYFSFTGAPVQLCVNSAGVGPGGLPGLLPGVGGGSCMMSVTLQFQSLPQTSLTFVFLDPAIPLNAPPGTFTLGMVLASLPF